MNVALLYFTTFFAEYSPTSAQADNVTNGNCQSLVVEALQEGNCECSEQLLEIRCNNLTHVPKFSGSFDSVFAGVYMSNQSIRYLEANSFANLPTLRLVLNFNDIEDRLDAAAFGGNLSEVVQELYLGACRLRGLPSGLFDNMNNLTVLHLWHNNIGRLPADLFRSCVNLRELILSHNQIASLEPKTFSALRSLKNLDLDCNSISTLSQDVFNGLTNLQVLHLRHNKVRMLAADTFLLLGDNLLVLSFDGNGLKFIRSGAFNGLTQLRSLSLGDNKMTFLPGADTFSKMLNLTVLVLRKSNLRSASLFSRLFDKLSGLKRLDLSSNNLRHLPVGALRSSARLRYVDLSENNLTTLSSCTLAETTAELTTFSLLGNKNLQCDCRLAWLVWCRCKAASNSRDAALRYVIGAVSE